MLNEIDSITYDSQGITVALEAFNAGIDDGGFGSGSERTISETIWYE